jgi:hypothetical protein
MAKSRRKPAGKKRSRADERDDGDRAIKRVMKRINAAMDLLGPVPADPLAADARWKRLLNIYADELARSEHPAVFKYLQPIIKELRSIAAASVKLTSRARLRQGEERVLRNQAELEQKMSERRSARLEKLPPEPAATEAHVEEPRQ